jgi:hypothetical protein
VRASRRQILVEREPENREHHLLLLPKLHTVYVVALSLSRETRERERLLYTVWYVPGSGLATRERERERTGSRMRHMIVVERARSGRSRCEG